MVGKLISTKYVLDDIVSLKTRFLYKAIEGRSSWDSIFNVLHIPGVHSEILFFRNNIDDMNHKIIRNSLNYEYFISSDASEFAVAAISENIKCHRNLTRTEQSKSSTWREMTAILYGLISFVPPH